jgi:hypothetical protein
MAGREYKAMAKKNNKKKKLVKIQIRKLDKVETTRPTQVNDG